MRAVVAFIGLALLSQSASAQRTFDVSPNGALRTLAAAIGAAHAGDRIVVHDGVYRGPTAVVDKRLTIEGDGRPVLDGENVRGLIVVNADDVTVRGLTLRNVGTSFVEGTGYNRGGDTNGIIVLYPQIGKSKHPDNPQDCWDWWGYTGSTWLEKRAPQMQAIAAMVNQLKARPQ